MGIIAEGQGELIGWHDPDENRRWIQENKSRDLRDKRMSVKDAVEQFVHGGDYVAIGGFGHIRVPMALVYEVIRQ
jgi:glutaconate CoA-transferase subunit A